MCIRDSPKRGQTSEPEATEHEGRDPEPGPAVERLQREAGRDERAQLLFRHGPVGEQQPLPGLRHDPWTTRKRPGPMSGRRQDADLEDVSEGAKWPSTSWPIARHSRRDGRDDRGQRSGSALIVDLGTLLYRLMLQRLAALSHLPPAPMQSRSVVKREPSIDGLADGALEPGWLVDPPSLG